MSQIGVADSVDMTPEEIIDRREKFVHSGAKKPLPTSPSTLTSRPQVILRVRGGVNCASIHLVSLRDIVIKSTGLSAAAASLDRLRANEINNTIIISTPCMDRADRYLKIATITIMDKSYDVSTHGIIKLPASLVEGNVLANLRESNPAINILTAPRMGTTDFILVAFEGLRISAAGHIGKKWKRVLSADSLATVKTSVPARPQLSAPNAEHQIPTCIICNGAHETGSSECRLHYKPPRTPPPATPEAKLALPAKRTTQATSQRPGQEKPQSSPGRKNPATAAQPPSPKQAWHSADSTQPRDTTRRPNNSELGRGSLPE
ncbi:hypothetical protein HPB52_009359 [Rhipicephalus sanguineus]|uniref:Uncharacterized protein n=1 Tax=Rhipicephalus sanguineus TaxID=34632 RepID=A0A9D4PSB6_RHISA|nr:hypothetical protein HPB52_009359 [Rhipicephalus sanguineus]